MSQLPLDPSPTSGPSSTQPPTIGLSDQLAAYLVHLIWRDLPAWDARRRLSRENAAALAEQLAEQLTPGQRRRLEAMRPRPEAA